MITSQRQGQTRVVPQCAENDNHTLVIYNRYSSFFFLRLTYRGPEKAYRVGIQDTEWTRSFFILSLPAHEGHPAEDLSLSRVSAACQQKLLGMGFKKGGWRGTKLWVSQLILFSIPWFCRNRGSLHKPGRRKRDCHTLPVAYRGRTRFISKPFAILTYQPWYR